MLDVVILQQLGCPLPPNEIKGSITSTYSFSQQQTNTQALFFFMEMGNYLKHFLISKFSTKK